MIGVDRQVQLVASRECRAALRSKGTRIMLPISAVAIAVVIVIANLAAGSADTPTIRLAVIGQPTTAEQATYEALGDAVGAELTVTTVRNDAAAREVIEGGVDVAILTNWTILTEEPVDLEGGSTLAAVINVLRSELAVAAGFADAGLTPEQIELIRAAPVPAVEALNTSDDATSRIGVAVVTNILLFILLQTYGGWLIQGVTREKSSRVVEVLLSALSPRQLLAGKIIGIGGVALLHAAVLAVAALVTAQIVGLQIVGGFRVADVAFAAVWFLLGYGLYCSVFAAAGALCDRAEDAQGASMPIMLPLIAAYIVGFSAFDGANTVLWVFAFLPPTAVLCMPVLSALGVVPAWAVIASMLLTAATAYLLTRLAARIYERSILKTGKRVSWREAIS